MKTLIFILLIYPVSTHSFDDWELEETPDEGELIEIDFDYISPLDNFEVVLGNESIDTYCEAD